MNMNHYLPFKLHLLIYGEVAGVLCAEMSQLTVKVESEVLE